MQVDDIIKFKDFDIVQKDNQMKVSTAGILLGAWCDTHDCHKVLDIGTGTGVIALIIAKKNQAAEIDAIEIDDLAYVEAQHNVDHSSSGHRINVLKGDIREFALKGAGPYDHIVCNPPFFSGGTLTDHQDKDAVRHTTKLGHGDLLIAVSKLLQEDGYFSVILPFMEGLRFIEMAERYKLQVDERVDIKSMEAGPVDRLLVKFKKCVDTFEITRSELTIKNLDGSYSEEFKSLAKDFYL